MFLMPRDLDIISALVRYYVLGREQVQQLFFEGSEPRVVRRRLQMLVGEHFISRTNPMIVDRSGTAAPTYYPALRGVETLAEVREDPTLLLTPTRCPNPVHVAHWLLISDFHIALDAALAKNPEITCDDFLNEWDVANKEESKPEDHYRLYTLVRDKPRLICGPDAGFVLRKGTNAKVHYLEMDRGTTGPNQIAKFKTAGYAGMAEQGLHRRHFPHANVPEFAVLSVSLSPKRRDYVREAVAESPGASLWRFASLDELTPEKILTEPVWHRCDGQVVPLVKTGGAA